MIINKLFYKKNSTISSSTKIYPFSRIMNSVIGSFSYVSYNCHINNTKIGNYCSIAKGVNIGLGHHPTNLISTSPVFYSPNNPLGTKIIKEKKYCDLKRTTIGNDVWIGLNAIILDGINIGDGAIIAANAVVVKDVLPYSIVGGVPAKHIKSRFKDEFILILNEIKWWNYSLTELNEKGLIDLFCKDVDSNILKHVAAKLKL